MRLPGHNTTTTCQDCEDELHWLDDDSHEETLSFSQSLDVEIIRMLARTPTESPVPIRSPVLADSPEQTRTLIHSQSLEFQASSLLYDPVSRLYHSLPSSSVESLGALLVSSAADNLYDLAQQAEDFFVYGEASQDDIMNTAEEESINLSLDPYVPSTLPALTALLSADPPTVVPAYKQIQLGLRLSADIPVFVPQADFPILSRWPFSSADNPYPPRHPDISPDITPVTSPQMYTYNC